ncbi:DNA repair protein RecO [Anaerovorax odorimutans]|uniref:DNA repair protein RecO n=1 Tax=Anaerovorax odorimutans TaxID=109327 RepID=UPI0003FAC943|nr:DNA repair protein RecO [Anaerovorax odorimutans]
MYTDTEGIILKQTKTVNGRRMIILFSRKYGKISAGTSINEKGRSKAALAMRPFTYGRYELFKNKQSYNINGAEVIKSYYKLGQDVEKYMCCSYVLEFTEKLIIEDVPAPKIFDLVNDFFDIMERRNKKYLSLVLAYQIKSLQLFGSMPQIRECVLCGSKDELIGFSVKDGGVICKKCMQNNKLNSNEKLIYNINFGIVDILEYILGSSLKSFEKLGLDDEILQCLSVIVKKYIEYHLDIGNLKSEGFLSD